MNKLILTILLGLAIQVSAEARSCSTVQVVEFTAKWCGVCQGMMRDVFSDPSVRAKLSTFKFVDKADYDQEGKYASAFGVSVLPTIIFLGADGKEIGGTRITGGMSRDGFLSHLNGVCQ